MTSRDAAPPLPHPQHPAAAARALSDAAQAAACAWAQPMGPAGHHRAISQLYSTLRDLGLAARGLARYQTTDSPPGLASPGFGRHVTASSRWLLASCLALEGVLAAEGIGPVPDPNEPGAALCQAARNTILAWRQSSGTSTDRDTTMKRLITATGFLTAATLNLATYAPPHSTTDLHAVGASLAEVTAYLTAATQEPAGNAVPGDGAGPDRHPGRPGMSRLPGQGPLEAQAGTPAPPDPASPARPTPGSSRHGPRRRA